MMSRALSVGLLVVLACLAVTPLKAAFDRQTLLSPSMDQIVVFVSGGHAFHHTAPCRTPLEHCSHLTRNVSASTQLRRLKSVSGGQDGLPAYLDYIATPLLSKPEPVFKRAPEPVSPCGIAFKSSYALTMKMQV